MSLYYNKTDGAAEPEHQGRTLDSKDLRAVESKVRRHPERADYRRETIDAILDEGLVGHLGFTSVELPYVLPMLYVREGDTLYLHGAPASRLLGTLAGGVPCCFTVTLLDGLVLARSAFHHSLNYRSVVVPGEGRAVSDRDEQLAALEALVEHVLPGRSSDARGPSAAELQVTEVIALGLEQASAKIRTGPPVDNRADLSLPVWAGELPLRVAVGEPVADPACTAPEPPSLRSYRRAHE
jgi:nitroimidazol reductase NimA-like FMN-containing flavoprotein (pyridoxamine 5'-phosphate oxidase superfamily)